MRKYGTITKQSEQAVLTKKAVTEHFFSTLVLVPFSERAGSTVYALVQCTVTVLDIPESVTP